MADDIRDPKDPNNKSRSERSLPSSHTNEPDHQLPWPQSSDPARLGERFEHGGSPEDRELGGSFEHSTEASERELAREFADPNFADNRRLANSFADPNSLDDGRIGKSFAESSSSAKKPPLKDRVHIPHPPKDPQDRKVLRWFLIGFAILFILVVLGGWLPRHFRDKETNKRAENEKSEKPMVETARVTRSKENAGLVLPGTTTPLTEAFVYARANGYLKVRLVDIGDHVRKNQLLAIIDAPDLDEQVSQAREQLKQAEGQLDQQKAQLALATVTVERYRVLVAKGVFSRQEGDQRETDYRAQQANVNAAQRNVEAYKANLRRVIALQSYEYVRAPFDGVITQRNVDVGALISASGSAGGSQNSPAPQGQTSSTGGSQQAGQSNNAGSSGSTNQSGTPSQSPGQGGPLFGVGQLQRLRIFVSVPEGYATGVHTGLQAQLAFQEYAGTVFHGDVTRTSGSVDPNTRTMLTEIQVDNRGGKLMPGMYAVATLPPAPGGNGPLLITGDAVALRHDQSVVGVVVDGKIRMVPVTLGRDYGSEIEVVAGIKEGDIIVTNVTDDVVDGAEVREHHAQAPEQNPAAPPPQNLPPGGSTQYSNEGITDRNLQGQQSKQNNKGSSGAQKDKGKPSNSESKP